MTEITNNNKEVEKIDVSNITPPEGFKTIIIELEGVKQFRLKR